MEGSVFRGLNTSQNFLSDLRSDLRGHLRPEMAKSVILPSLKDDQDDDNFFILQGPHLRSFKAATSIRLVRPRFRGTSEVT